MKKQRKKRTYKALDTLIAESENAFVQLSRGRPIQMRIDLDSSGNPSYLEGVEFKPSLDMVPKMGLELPIQILDRLSKAYGFDVTADSYIAVGYLEGNSQHSGAAIMVSKKGERKAMIGENLEGKKEDKEFFQELRAYLVKA